MEMEWNLKLQVIHIAGTQMTQQGADGLSQGDFSGGGLSGQNMLAFVPLHQSALERAEPLLSWIRE